MKALLLAAALFATHAAAALDLAPGTTHTLTGKVTSLQSDRTFVVTTGADKVLVYANADQVKALQVGSAVEVRGKVPTDWVKLARFELQAADVRVR